MITVESLLTEKTYQNQSKRQSEPFVRNDSVEQIDNKPTCIDQVGSLKLVNVEKLSATTSSPNRQSAKLLCDQLPSLMSDLRVDCTLEREKPSETDELLAKLIHLLPRMKEVHFKRAPIDVAHQKENINYGNTSAFMFVGDIEHHIGDIHFDTFDSAKWPNPMYIAKALTLSKANDLWNMEQLETVGDAFLKASTVLYLYFRYPTYDEGKLSQLNTALVCNDNLYRLAVERDNCLIARYINSEILVINQNWIVPFYTINKCQTVKPSNRQIKNKSIADCVEALIGACCLFGSAGAALRLFEWLGLVAFDPAQYLESELRYPTQYYQREYKINFDGIEFEDQDELEMISRQYKVDLEFMVREAYDFGLFSQVESVIGYSFKHRYFLVQAFTHPSYTLIEYAHQNHIASYQRLEFIGDAILDYVITYFVYRQNDQLSPMNITQIRSALVNNIFYASVVVKYGLHKYLRHSSDPLDQQIGRFVKHFQCQLLSQFGSMIRTSCLRRTSVPPLMRSMMTKTLADIFKALVGAIYIDAGFSLDVVWRVVYKMIKVEFDYIMEHIPTTPLAWLERMFFNRYTFTEETIQVDEERKQIELIIEPTSHFGINRDNGNVTEEQEEAKRFVGFGQTKKQCMTSAAKRAMAAYLKNESK